MNTHPSSLRAALVSAVKQRRSAMRNGRSYRKDHDRVNAALGRAEVFLHSYPYASDERVREWCRANLADVCIIVPGHTPRNLARLLMDELHMDAEVRKLANRNDE